MVLGQVGLGDISGDDGAAIEADLGQQHVRLGIGGVVRLIENDKSVAECASSQIGQWSNFYSILAQMKLWFVMIDPLFQRIIERAEIGINLLFQVSRQKSPIYTRFDGRPGQNDLLDLPAFQSPYGKSHGSVGLSGTRWTDGKQDIVFFRSTDEGALARCLCHH